MERFTCLHLLLYQVNILVILFWSNRLLYINRSPLIKFYQSSLYFYHLISVDYYFCITHFLSLRSLILFINSTWLNIKSFFRPCQSYSSLFLAHTLEQVNVSSSICLNSPSLLSPEYLYYSCFPLVSSYPPSTFFSNEIVKLLTPSYRYFQNTKQITSSFTQSCDKKLFLFLSQPYEQESFLLRVLSFVNEFFLLVTLLLYFHTFKSL